jgi:hypothetical protein
MGHGVGDERTLEEEIEGEASAELGRSVIVDLWVRK